MINKKVFFLFIIVILLPMLLLFKTLWKVRENLKISTRDSFIVHRTLMFYQTQWEPMQTFHDNWPSKFLVSS
jgi:hypothetical protein